MIVSNKNINVNTMQSKDIVVKETNSFVKTTCKSGKRKLINNGSAGMKKDKLEKELYKPPTAQELYQLKETQNSFHSELFRLQIEQVLDAVKLKNKYREQFEDWFENFKKEISAIGDMQEIQLDNEILLMNDIVQIPIKKLNNDCTGFLKFLPPSNIAIGGSYALDTIIGPNTTIDVYIEMPKEIFQRIDCKNYRYMQKKALYLSVIASCLSKDLVESKKFVGSSTCPILKLVPNGKSSKYIDVHVYAVVKDTTFQLSKLTPEKSNVKSDWYFNENCDTRVSTPLYNNIIMRDSTILKFNAEHVEEVKKHPGIRDGIILLKIWLRQRELGIHFESFNGHVITMIVLYLLQTGKLYKLMTAYQVVRNTWHYLANDGWYENGIKLCRDDDLKIKERISLYYKYYDFVFLDTTGFHNLAANISADVCRWISCQAKMAIDSLNSNRVNSFQILFMRKAPFYTSFDHIICIHNERALKNILKAVSSADEVLNYTFNEYLQGVRLVTNTLRKGLKNRISFVMNQPCKMKEWNLTDKAPDSLEKIFIGIQLNPDFAFDIVERGPEANLAEAAGFREFWGRKSELRRFKDARICEAVVWANEGVTLAEKRAIPRMIVKYLLEEKLKLFEKSHYVIVSNQMEQVLRPSKLTVPKLRYGSEEVAHRAINVFDELKTELCSLSELPLSIHALQGCSPVFRYTEVFPPLGLARRSDGKSVASGESQLLFAEATAPSSSSSVEVPTYLGLIEATMQLSHSGRWPDELEALRMTKAAFYLQIADCLRKQYKLCAHASRHYIDIAKKGLVFRIRIAHSKEASLVKQTLDNKDGLIKYKDNEESMELEKNLAQLPQLTGALFGLHCQHPSFGAACCLAKRWLSAHLVDDFHMPNIVVELLLASMYLNPGLYQPAQTPQLAFLRFLDWFANEHWTTDPIIVNFNAEMSADEILQVENFFGSNRESLPPLFISTSYDKQASVWTRKAPNTMILNRVSSLARESCKVFLRQLLDGVAICAEPLFTTPLSEYDCIIRLASSLNSRKFESLDVKQDDPNVILHLCGEQTNIKMPIIDFDPAAKYVKELRSIYGEFALFFHDTYGGTVVGVLLKPDAHLDKDFKVSNVACQKLTKNNKLILNVPAMLQDFYTLGKGLVESINIQSKKLEQMQR